MEAGNLRHKITLQAPAGGCDDPYSAKWNDVCTVYASVMPLKGRELWEAQAAQSLIDHRVVIRYRAGVRRNMRVVFGNRIFDILYIIDKGERHEWLQLMCREWEE